MKRKLDWRLASLQITSVCAAIVFVACSVRLYHHQSTESFIPFWRYLGSVRLAVPPILLLFLSYILIFIGGISLGDAPKVVIGFLKNRFFQSSVMMIVTGMIFVCASVSFLVFTSTTPSPNYSQFVKTMLGGEADRHTLAAKQLEKIDNQNPVLAERFRIAASVFEERSRRNFAHAEVGTTVPRILVRSLEANVKEGAWQDHPIRLLALARLQRFSSRIRRFWSRA